MKNIVFAIQDDIRQGVLSFRLIAAKHGVSIFVVMQINNEMLEQEFA